MYPMESDKFTLGELVEVYDNSNDEDKQYLLDHSSEWFE